jgi:hypothetical protein
LLREKVSEKGKWSLQDVYSIRFSKKEKSFELRRPFEVEHLSIWREALTQRLSQFGFH